MLIKKLPSLTVARKLWLLSFFAAAGIAILTALFLISERTLILDERENGVRQAVEAAHGVLDHYHALAQSGTMPEQEAQRRALQALERMRYSGNEYFWVNDLQARMVMHPISPRLNGTEMRQHADPAGKLLFVEMVEIVQKRGAGFVFYLWPKPGSAEPVQKVSYVKGFAPWGWIVGSGVYLDSVDATFMQRLIQFGAGAALLTAVLLTICVLLARSITRALGQAVTLADRVAAGDLTCRIESAAEDETGQLLRALQSMNGGLVDLVGEVRERADTIATATVQIASGNQDLASRTETQASSLEETASAMEELTGTVRQNAEHARQANLLAASASEVAGRGGEVVKQVEATMRTIDESAQKMSEILGVIDSLAFQTNILALNAAVEAARAGERGRGFAVVASEVRQLAQRSASAAQEIKTLIGKSVDQIGTGSRLASSAGATMDEIVLSVNRVTAIMGEISAASMEQSAGIEQVNQAITQMDRVTQQNAALVEEAAAAANSLQEQAENLVRATNVFRLARNEGQHGGHRATPGGCVINASTRPLLRTDARRLAAPSPRPPLRAA